MAKRENAVIYSECLARDASELASMLKSKREEYAALQLKRATGRLRQTHMLKAVRRDVARLVSLLARGSAKVSEVSE
jgi:ribosomal protein L29